MTVVALPAAYAVADLSLVLDESLDRSDSSSAVEEPGVLPEGPCADADTDADADASLAGPQASGRLPSRPPT
jgi:hypothetical protein